MKKIKDGKNQAHNNSVIASALGSLSTSLYLLIYHLQFFTSQLRGSTYTMD